MPLGPSSDFLLSRSHRSRPVSRTQSDTLSAIPACLAIIPARAWRSFTPRQLPSRVPDETRIVDFELSASLRMPDPERITTCGTECLRFPGSRAPDGTGHRARVPDRRGLSEWRHCTPTERGIRRMPSAIRGATGDFAAIRMTSRGEPPKSRRFMQPSTPDEDQGGPR